MDHHCPYIYNCVGANNQLSFTIFSWAVLVVGFCTLYFQCYAWAEYGQVWYYKFSFIHTGIFLLLDTYVCIGQVAQATKNLTTNERMNLDRYDYLKDAAGSYYNPFSRGWKMNVLEFLRIKKALTEEDISLLGVLAI